MAYFDIDEYLFLDCSSVQKLLSQGKFDGFDCIAVNWKYFDDNGHVGVSNGNYSMTRFTHAFEEEDWEWAQHRFSKRIIRTHRKLTINSSHGPIVEAQMSEYGADFKNSIKACNIEGKALAHNHLAFRSWSHNGGYLAHYRYKTIEEYITNKMKRGYPTL